MGTSKAVAIFFRLIAEIFLSPRSTEPMYVRSKLLKKDSFSCDKPTPIRITRIRSPSFLRYNLSSSLYKTDYALHWQRSE